MKRLRRTPVIVVALAVCLAGAGGSAQTEKVSVRMAPQPGQSIRMDMTQEMDFDLSFDGPTAAGLTSMTMQMRSTMALTQKTGPRKADGSVDAEVTYDEFRTELLMNGQAMPAGAGNEFVGKVVTLTYNRAGEIVGVKGLPAGGIPDDTFKQMMGTLLGNLPTTAIGVGETMTAPLDFSLPLPLPGTGPMKLDGETRITLVSIDKDAQGRSARFRSTVNGKMVNDTPPAGTNGITFDFTIGGEGTTVMDLDKGVPRSTVSTSTLEGKLGMPAGAAPGNAPGMLMRGTIKVTMTGK